MAQPLREPWREIVRWDCGFVVAVRGVADEIYAHRLKWLWVASEADPVAWKSTVRWGYWRLYSYQLQSWHECGSERVVLEDGVHAAVKAHAVW